MKLWKTMMPGVLILMLTLTGWSCNAQYLNVENKDILDGDGEPIILRGIGLGGWMLQEGYMLRTYGAQYEIENRIEELIGEEGKNEFYTKWWANHCTKSDIDSMAAWGFNSVRLPMHYKMFTPPIEEEPVAGEITWKEDGFVMVDDLLSWIEANDMYLILDLHAAPGGQGENADISDYDPSKPSLWESEDNKNKMVALWKKLAERYANEPNIGGYDLINETNWGFDDNHESDLNGCNQSNNAPLWDIQKRCIEAIREVDQNHLIVIEGNCWGNNYNGLPDQLWDDNIVISYHKYWNANDQGSLAPLLETQNKWNVPLWLGETGENSNAWFTDAIELLEANNIGWSWWPQKKMGGNNVQEIPINDGYQDILDYWGGQGDKPSETDAYDALMGIAENLKAENNVYHFDVVDAMTRAPYDKTAIPFQQNVIMATGNSTLYFTDYDLGNQSIAYSDDDYSNETADPGGAAWNLGGRYRNDGVDIEVCEDEVTNGYNVGWTNDGEWIQYTLDVESDGVYDIGLRYASVSESIVRILIDGDDQSGSVSLEATGGYQSWSTFAIEDLIIDQGQSKLKFYIEKGGANLNYMEFAKVGESADLSFESVSAVTSETGNQVNVTLNKEVDPSTVSSSGFNLDIDGNSATITSVAVSATSNRVLVLDFNDIIGYTSEMRLSYDATDISTSEEQALAPFNDLNVEIGLPVHYTLPGKIQAEDFFEWDGLALEKSEDTGGGHNLAYTSTGDYASYYLTLDTEGEFDVQARVACFNNSGTIEFQQLSLDGVLLNSVKLEVPVTGGWQDWETTAAVMMHLDAGRTILKMVIDDPEFNINWYKFTEFVLSTGEESIEFQPSIYPNPSTGDIIIELSAVPSNTTINVISTDGKILWGQEYQLLANTLKVSLPQLDPGVYLIEVIRAGNKYISRVILE
ncbi:MAG: cellulase family glycosylhydrolase [Reichenbachiella sp.]